MLVACTILTINHYAMTVRFDASHFKAFGNIRHSTDGDEHLVKGYRKSVRHDLTILAVENSYAIFDLLNKGAQLDSNAK